MSNLLQHLLTERGPVRFEDLLCDCAAMRHVADFPRDERELRRQLSALVRAGLVTWDEEAGVVQVVGEQLPVDPQASLFR